MKDTINKKLIKRLIADGKPKKQFEIWDAKLSGFILRVNKSGKMNYVCQYERHKRINIGSASALDPDEARKQCKKIMVDFINGIDPLEKKRTAKANSFKSYIETVYEPWVMTHHKDGQGTIKRIKASFFPTFGKCELSEITAKNVEKWRAEKLKSGNKPATTNRSINTLKASLNRAVDWGILKENPLSRVKPQKLDTNGIIRFLSNEEEVRLRSALDSRDATTRKERDSANAWRETRHCELLPDLNKVTFCDYLKPLILLDLNTGLRRGELFNLTWNDVDLERAMLTVKGAGAKSSQTRHIPLNEEAADVLHKWKSQSKSDSFVFPGKNGDRMDNIKKSWTKLVKDANINDFRFHDLRHTFASNLVMAGVDLNTVRDLLGHSDIKMTLRYAHLAPEVKANAVAKLVKGKI